MAPIKDNEEEEQVAQTAPQGETSDSLEDTEIKNNIASIGESLNILKLEINEKTTLFEKLKIDMIKALSVSNERAWANDKVSIFTVVKNTYNVPDNIKVTVGLEEFKMSELTEAISNAKKSFTETNEPTGETTSLTVTVKPVLELVDDLELPSDLVLDSTD